MILKGTEKIFYSFISDRTVDMFVACDPEDIGILVSQLQYPSSPSCAEFFSKHGVDGCGNCDSFDLNGDGRLTFRELTKADLKLYPVSDIC